MFSFLSGIPIQTLLTIFGPLAIAIAVFFKGYFMGKSSAGNDQADAQRALDSKARAAEAHNQFIEKNRGQDVQTAQNASTSPSTSISVWNGLGWGPKNGK